MEGLQETLLHKRLMKSLPYYIRSRHTGNVENFNSMLTKYTPKRNAFGCKCFTGRTLLAAFDQNHHAFRPYVVTRDGKSIYHRKYSKRSKNYSVQPVKTTKQFNYYAMFCKGA